jgi:rubrerythrin
MSVTFNADEVFEMAEEIERNAARFYREAGQNAADDNVKKMLLSLADMEEGHQKTFAQMRRELTAEERESNVFDPDNQVGEYLRTMADFHGTEGKAGPDEKLTGRESLTEILKIALQAEKNSIAFYVGIKDMVSSKAAKQRVQAIIIEEMAHVSTLGGRLQSIK